MKKSMIWLLSGVMAFAFIGLLVLQVQYIVTILKTNNEQFEMTVRNCLENVSREIEREEARTFWTDNDLGETFSYKNSSNNQVIPNIRNQSYAEFSINDSMIMVRMGSMSIPQTEKSKAQKSTIVATSEELQKLTMDRYYRQKDIFDDVVYRLNQTNYLKPIELRLNFKMLESSIESEFVNSGLNLPFVMMVVDNNQRIVYQSVPLAKPPKSSDIITQVIFPIDPPSRLNYLKIYFPTR
ncbi:MAG: two-component sensor histidine kinase, partial [Tannerella sp.]|nr:two-component sensor histidine kinase [Tannerella sp.]